MSAPSPGVESKAFSAAEYDAMLEEVREHLPLFLQAGAAEHHDPLGDVKGITGLDAEDLRRVVAVHVSLSEEVAELVAALPEGLRRPITSSARPPQPARAVRGAVDWGATFRARAGAGWDPGVFVVRPGQRIFDTPENATLVWALRELEVAAARALRGAASRGPLDIERGWHGRLERVLHDVRWAFRTEWLRDVEARRPDASALRRLEGSRAGFYRLRVLPVVRMLLRAARPTEHDLVAVLCQRYFVPDKTWRLFEVTVALRLARAFAEVAVGPRRTRLLAGAEGVRAYARYRLADGDEIHLTYQGWSASRSPSQRWSTANRHGFRPGRSIPDLVMCRTGKHVDCVVLELKATKNPGYLGAGLSQLLGYLGERPGMFGTPPAGWLVAPPSEAFRPAPPSADEPLWVVGADAVAEAAVARLAA